MIKGFALKEESYLAKISELQDEVSVLKSKLNE